jgi:3-hydroxyacyl-CoA dehydrogenase/3-hydroxy-2-methylbutyryl-CoA dehydrogenase
MDTPMLAGANEQLRKSLMDLTIFPKRLGRAGDMGDLVRAFMEQPMLNGEVIRLDGAVRLAPR